MSEPLHPSSLGEILDRTFQIYRGKFLLSIGIAALPALASMALGLAFFVFEEFGPDTTLSASSKFAIKQAASLLPNQWQYSFLNCLMWPVFAYLASRTLLNEESTLGSAYSFCKARWKSCLALAFVLWFAWHLLPSVLNRIAMNSELAFSASHTFGGAAGNYSFTFYQFIFGLPRWTLEYLTIVLLAFSIPAWSLEGLGVRPALLRGLTFARRNWPRVFAAWLMVNVLEWILFTAFWGLFLIALRLCFGDSYGGLYYKLRFSLSIPAIQGISILIAPVLPIAITLFYYDQRIRLEGYDIERMMDAAGLNAPVTPPAEAVEGRA